MKTIVATLAAAAALATVAIAPAASAHPHGWHHHRPHKVCFFHHGHRVCRWR